MKLHKLATLLACTSLLAFTVNAAPTHVHYIEIDDEDTIMRINQDENELMQVSLRLDKEKHEFIFTPEELKDPSAIQSKLDAKGAELEAHAMELERLHQQQEGEYEFIVEAIEGSVADIVSEFDDLDIEFSHVNGHGNRIVIISDEDDDKQAIKKALN